jgi:hypothetical protein
MLKQWVMGGLIPRTVRHMRCFGCWFHVIICPMIYPSCNAVYSSSTDIHKDEDEVEPALQFAVLRKSWNLGRIYLHGSGFRKL